MAGGGKTDGRRPGPVTPERATAARPAEREGLKGRVITEAEWLNPGLGRPRPGGSS